MKFQFRESTHTYLANGRDIPSCTRCLDHAGLVDFRFVREDILEKRSRLGVEVHRAIHYFCEGDLDLTSVAEEVIPYLQSWIKLQEKTRFVADHAERQLIAEMNGLYYGMKVDLAGKFGGEDAVLDLKTGKAQWYHGVQLAGYAIGLPHAELTTPMGKFSRRRRYVIELRADGEMAKAIPYRNQRDFHTFWAALEITNRKLDEGKKLLPLEEAAEDGRDDYQGGSGQD